MKTIEDYIIELDKVEAKIKPLEAKRTRIRKMITKMKEDASKVFQSNLPNKLEDYTIEQIEWLLYHYHDETSVDYNKKNVIFNSLNLFSTGINGGEYVDTIRQSRFLATSNWFPFFVDFYKVVKEQLKDFPSVIDKDKNVIVLDTHTNVFGWDYCYDGVNLEIDKETDTARFIKGFGRLSTNNTSDWVSFDKIQELLIKYED